MRLLLIGIAALFLFYSCRMGRSHYMSDNQRQKLETAYETLQEDYRALMDSSEMNASIMSGELKSMYAQMQQMHRQMDVNHRQMMAVNMGRHMQGNSMMGQGMSMHMQGHMTGEWYFQMISMHEQMAALHEKRGQGEMAGMNRRLGREYRDMMDMVPDLDEPSEVPFNETGDPSVLNGKNLYTQNCASCHGGDAKGLAGVFPPLIDSEWLTENKETPIRILMNGLTGPIEVNGQTYNGSMPSFKARLSAAEMAAILNYIRSLSGDDLSEITQQDVIRVGKTYSERTRPWNTEDLEDK